MVPKNQQISKRKADHIKIILNEATNFRQKRSGFEFYEFEHNALPELNANRIDTSTKFLGKQLSFPFMVSSMTGGFLGAEKINGLLATVCNEFSVAMGVGSQRQTLENSNYIKSFNVVRQNAPNILLVGNIGAAEIASIKDVSPIQRLVDTIQADAFAIHLNPLQEFLQPEGKPNFVGVLKGIEKLVKYMSVPIIVKEIGAGISPTVAQKLINVGVNIIDTAGAGGTSWAGVEIIRRSDDSLAETFWDWGIPTAESIIGIRKLSKKITIIGSGGIRSGLDIAKALALGADIAASATPIMKALKHGGERGIIDILTVWKTELQGVMFLVGAKNIVNLKKTKIYESKQKN